MSEAGQQTSDLRNRRRLSWWLAWVSAGLVFALLGPIVVLGVLNRDSPGVWSVIDPSSPILAIVYSVTGILLATRRPTNLIGWMLLAIGLAWQLSALSYGWAVYGLITEPGAVGAAAALWVGLALSAIPFAASPTILLLLFPDGHLSSWPRRLIAGFAGLAIITLAVTLATGTAAPPGFPSLFEQTENPLAYPAIINPGHMIVPIVLCGLTSVTMLLVGLKRSSGQAHQQYKWIVMAMALVVVAFVADFFARSLETSWHVITSPLQSASFGLVPVAMAVAILRHQLWDIDIIINRALVYTTLTASLGLGYVSLIVLLQYLLNPLTGQSDLIVAGSTLAVAALTRPVRDRIQIIVNRQFYREKYDAARTIDAFTTRMRDNADLDTITAGLEDVVQETMQPTHTSIWLRPTPSAPRQR